MREYGIVKMPFIQRSAKEIDGVYQLLSDKYFGAQEVSQFDLEMNNHIKCMHYIIRENYWRPSRAATNYLFFQKKKKRSGHLQNHK